MQLLTRDMLDTYLHEDAIVQMLDSCATPSDESFTTQRWLRESVPKRCIFMQLYGDLLAPSSTGMRVLDVGGGYTALTRLLVRSHQYMLLDIMSHDSKERVQSVERDEGKRFLIERDWYAYAEESGEYDIVIANDLFPNVDQRLELFLQRYLPKCRELRLSLTYYNTPRWYAVKRLDGEEVFHMLAWDGDRTRRALETYAPDIGKQSRSALLEDRPSLYPNGRQVCLVTLKGRVMPQVTDAQVQGFDG